MLFYQCYYKLIVIGNIAEILLQRIILRYKLEVMTTNFRYLVNA